MKPLNFRGNVIPSDLFNVLEGYGKIVGALRYSEAKSKDNLFFKADGEVTYFVDMRRYDFDESWTVPMPQFYYLSTVGGYDKDKVRVVSEANTLIKAGVPISWDRNYFLHSWEHYCAKWDISSFKRQYCLGCRESLKKRVSEPFCNSDCKLVYEKKRREERYNRLERCEACGKKIVAPYIIENSYYDGLLDGHDESEYVVSSVIVHHVRYEPPEIMVVCRRCHAKITFRKNCVYAAVDSRPIIEKKFSLVPCTVPGCGSRARVAIGDDPLTAKCYRCKRGLRRVRVEIDRYKREKREVSDEINAYKNLRNHWQNE